MSRHDLKRMPELDSQTTVAYTNGYAIVLFDRCDNHLAAIISGGQIVYECGCINRGRELIPELSKILDDL